MMALEYWRRFLFICATLLFPTLSLAVEWEPGTGEIKEYVVITRLPVEADDNPPEEWRIYSHDATLDEIARHWEVAMGVELEDVESTQGLSYFPFSFLRFIRPPYRLPPSPYWVPPPPWSIPFISRGTHRYYYWPLRLLRESY